jgi:hypothetical protein
VLISADEHQRPERHDRQVLTLSDFTEADITALEATRPPESSKVFDHELATTKRIGPSRSTRTDWRVSRSRTASGTADTRAECGR